MHNKKFPLFLSPSQSKLVNWGSIRFVGSLHAVCSLHHELFCPLTEELMVKAAERISQWLLVLFVISGLVLGYECCGSLATGIHCTDHIEGYKLSFTTWVQFKGHTRAAQIEYHSTFESSDLWIIGTGLLLKVLFQGWGGNFFEAVGSGSPHSDCLGGPLNLRQAIWPNMTFHMWIVAAHTHCAHHHCAHIIVWL